MQTNERTNKLTQKFGFFVLEFLTTQSEKIHENCSRISIVTAPINVSAYQTIKTAGIKITNWNFQLNFENPTPRTDFLLFFLLNFLIFLEEGKTR